MTSALVPLSPSAVSTARGTPTHELKPLTPDEVKAVLQDEIQSAIGGTQSTVADERRLSLRYYYGRPFGNELEGRSQVVLTDVADTIEWIMPSLMRMFLGGPQTVRYNALKPQDDQAAPQATDFVNADFRDNQGGFLLFYNWMKDALIEKVGIVALTAEERLEPKKETYHGLTIGGLTLLLQDPELTPMAFAERPDGMFDVMVGHMRTETRIVAEGVAPEEFMIARRETKLSDRTPFVGRRRRVTRSDLLSLGYERDLVLQLPAATLDSPEWTGEREERRRDEDESFGSVTRADVASQEVWLNDCYIRIDEDGDGYSELRHMVAVGDTVLEILEDTEVICQPFSVLCPIPMPHKFFGISIADTLRDLQLIRSTLLRQMLDNLYLTNNPQLEVVEGQVEIDDLLNGRPGNLVRVMAPGMVNPIVLQPLSPMAFNMMEWLEGVKENRVGASRWMQGIDASALKSTATGITSLMASAQARVELIARIFAEGGVKDFFRTYLKLIASGGLRAQVMKLRGEWIEMDPSTWTSEMGVEIEVGLGTGQAAERMAFLAQVLTIQAQIAQSGLTNVVTPQNIYNAANKMTDAMGFRQGNLFFTNPEGSQPPPPQPDPRIYESDRRAKDNEAERQVSMKDLERQVAEALADQKFKRLELEEKMKLERDRLASQERIALRKCELDAEIARTQARAKKANGKAEEAHA